ncbi:MAG: alginate export family protein, partial [Gammaproteobacteria bacterium]|nr:alginate export family protein [Gammaproteobacteria bacterium]
MVPFAAVLAIALQAVSGSETNGETAGEPAGGQQPTELTPAVSFSVEHRTRYEHLNNQFRAGRSSDDRLLVFRTLAAVELDAGRFRVSTEFQDARTELADAETPLSTSIVNPVDLLQAYVEVPVDNLLAEGSSSVLRGGRVTMDIGSRRLIARDNFTNVSYAFTGVDWQWTGPDDSRLRTFFTFPVQRQVSGDILENRPKFDTESGNVRFW